MKAGDRVVYAADPLLFGVMEITRVGYRRVPAASGFPSILGNFKHEVAHYECRSIYRALEWPKNLIEIFYPGELEHAPDPAGGVAE